MRLTTTFASVLCRRTLLYSAAGIGSLCAIGLYGAHSKNRIPSPKNPHPNPIVVEQIALRTDEGETLLPAVSLLVRIEADATAATNSDKEALTEIKAAMLPMESLSADGAKPALPDWFVWGRFDGARILVKAIPEDVLPDGQFSVYGSRAAETTAVCFANRSARVLRTELRLRLPQGIWSVERLTFTPRASTSAGPVSAPANAGLISTAPDTGNGVDKATDTVEKSKDSDQASRQNLDLSLKEPRIRLERLEGCDFGGTAVVRKPFELQPGQVCFYRFLDRSKAILSAWNDAHSMLRHLAGSNSGPANRLRKMLDEGEPYLAGTQSGTRSSSSRRVGCVHRLMLYTSQAVSLHRNYLARGTVEKKQGGEIMRSLERLTDALSETSAVLLGLVPQVAVIRAGIQVGAIGASKSLVALQPAQPAKRKVLVALANTGTQSIENVRIGLDSSELPKGVICEPSDAAFFGTLLPGQTARAVFEVHVPAGVALPDNRLAADVSYFAAKLPAHLRPHAY